MANLTLYRVPSDRLSELPQSDGQLIFLEDRPGCVYDIGDDRVDLSFGATGEVLWTADSVSTDPVITVVEMADYICKYRQLEIVFAMVDGVQFSTKMWGVPVDGGYYFGDMPLFYSSYDVNESSFQTVNGDANGITMYRYSIKGYLDYDGSIITENADLMLIQMYDGTLEVENHNIYSNDWIGPYQVIGWR